MILQKGNNGPNVIYLQQALNALGYQLPISGNFDASTELAVMNFQGVRGLRQDGVYGIQTAMAVQDSLGRDIVAATMLQQMQLSNNPNLSINATTIPIQNQNEGQIKQSQTDINVSQYAVPIAIVAGILYFASKR